MKLERKVELLKKSYLHGYAATCTGMDWVIDGFGYLFTGIGSTFSLLSELMPNVLYSFVVWVTAFIVIWQTFIDMMTGGWNTGVNFFEDFNVAGILTLAPIFYVLYLY